MPCYARASSKASRSSEQGGRANIVASSLMAHFCVRPIKNPEGPAISDSEAHFGAVLHRLWIDPVPCLALVPCVGADVDISVIFPPVRPVEFVEVAASTGRVSAIPASPPQRPSKTLDRQPLAAPLFEDGGIRWSLILAHSLRASGRGVSAQRSPKDAGV